MKSLKSLMVPALLLALSQSAIAVPGLMVYQGRLTQTAGDPVTTPVEVVFTFWSAEVGGDSLGGGFSDTDTVTPDANGVFEATIGDDPGNLMPASIFGGSSVWLQVRINGVDLAPRQRIASVGYAVRSLHADDADTLAGQLPASFSPYGHSHGAGDITSGILDAERIPVTIARDDEILSILLMNDGLGSGLDADLLDGQQASAFANAVHLHSAADITSGVIADARVTDALTVSSAGSVDAGAIKIGTVAASRIDAAIARDSEILPAVLAGDGAGSGLDADTVDGKHATQLVVTSVGGLSGGTISSGVTVQGNLTATTVVQAGSSPQVGFAVGTGDVVAADDLLAANNLGLGGGGSDGAIFIKNQDGTLDAVTISGPNRSIKINPPKTRWLSMGHAITPMVNDDAMQDCWVNYAATLYADKSKRAYGYYGVHLPHGAAVTGLHVWGRTDDASHIFDCSLYRKAVAADTGAQTMAVVSSVNTNMTLSDTSVSYATIDNQNYEYFIHMREIGESKSDVVSVYGVRISYTIDEWP